MFNTDTDEREASVPVYYLSRRRLPCPFGVCGCGCGTMLPAMRGGSRLPTWQQALASAPWHIYLINTAAVATVGSTKNVALPWNRHGCKPGRRGRGWKRTKFLETKEPHVPFLQEPNMNSLRFAHTKERSTYILYFLNHDPGFNVYHKGNV